MKVVDIASWIAIYCIMMYFGDASGSEKVNIGAIFSLNTTIGKVSQIAINAAVEEINADPSLLGGLTLSLKIHDSGNGEFLSLMGVLEFMQRETVAIIGPETSGTAHILGHLANKLHIPLLSYTALDPGLSRIQYPYFFQTAPNDTFQMAAIAETVSYYSWTQVIVIFTDDLQSRNGISILREKLAEKRCKISHKVVLPVHIKGNRSTVVQKLAKVKLMESKVFVVHTFARSGEIILKTAEQLGLMDKGYVWIATSWLPGILDSEPHSDIFKMAQGIVTFRLHTPESQRKRAFVTRWNQLSNGSVGLNVHGLYAYDTVWLVTRAVKAFLDQGNNISFSKNPFLAAFGGGNLNLSAFSIFDGGKRLVDITLETNFTGLTGPFGFESAKLLSNPYYDVINIVGNQLRRIGYWSDYSGLSVVAPETLRNKPHHHSTASQRLNGMVWPGGAKHQPRGWAFPRDGRKLRIGVPRRVSFQDFIYQDNHTHEVRGYCVDVFLAALKLIPYAVPYEFKFFGDGYQNPNYSELVNRITLDEFDAAVGDIAIVTTRTWMVDFSQPYIDSGLIVVVPVKKLRSNDWAFSKPFTSHMWAATGASVLIVGGVVWILEHGVNKEFRGHPRTQLKTTLWFSFSTLFSTHRQETVNSLSRMVLIVWLVVVLIIQESYTASLSSFLAVQQLKSPIKGIDSLITSNGPIGFQVGSYAENYLNQELGIAKSRLKALKSPEDYADALAKRRVVAVVDELPYVNLFLSKYCQFTVAGHVFTSRGWGFAFKKDFPLTLDMSNALLHLSESKRLQNITETWLANRTACSSENADSDPAQLELNDFVGLFLITGVACIIALIIHLCSMLCQSHQDLPPKSEPSRSTSSCSTPSKVFVSVADKKGDLSKRRMKRRRLSISSNVFDSM